MLLNKLDEQGRLAWFTVLVVAFWVAWPIGLAIVAFLAITGRLQAWRADMQADGWFNLETLFPGRRSMPVRWPARRKSSGNQAFDHYRDATISRLETEQREFQAFLEKLRQARDKAEFDSFMAERREKGSDAPVMAAEANT